MSVSWYLVRDTFLGQNWEKQDILGALKLAEECDREEAVWLRCVFKDHFITRAEDAKQFLGCLGKEASALCFACLVTNIEDSLSEHWLEEAAHLGHPLAQACFARRFICSDVTASFDWASKSALQGEREGFVELGRIFLRMRSSGGSDMSNQDLLDQAKVNFLHAASFGSVYAMEKVAELTNVPIDKCLWMGKAALHSRDASRFMQLLFHQRESKLDKKSIFALGCALNGHINENEQTIFGDHFDFDRHVPMARFAIDFHRRQTECARMAVFTWSLIAKRLGIVKDVRLIVSKMVWHSRSDAAFEVACLCPEAEESFLVRAVHVIVNQYWVLFYN